LESANIVGYQTKSVQLGQSFQGCAFDQIGVDGAVLDIQKLIPVDENGDIVGGGDVNIQFYNSFGKFLNSYAYYEEDGWDTDCPAGWYDEELGELAVYSFNPAEGFKVYTGTEANFLYSGEVNMAETFLPVRQGQSFQVNARPTEVNIQAIIPVDESEEIIGGGDVNIQFYNSFGKFLYSYAYYEEDGWDTDCPAGWYDEELGELADYSFGASEGFKVYSGTECFLRFPEM
jgi:hypothetical protein